MTGRGEAWGLPPRAACSSRVGGPEGIREVVAAVLEPKSSPAEAGFLGLPVLFAG